MPNTWLDVDKLVGKSYREGKYTNSNKELPCTLPVRAVTFDGVFQKTPRTHLEWQSYSAHLLTLFDKVWREEETPKWDMLKFRYELDFKAGIWAGFTATWLIFINCLPEESSKFVAYKHVTQGISIFDNQYYLAPGKARPYKRSRTIYHLATSSFKNELYEKWHKKLGLKGNEPLTIADQTLSLRSHYPIQIKKVNGVLEKREFFQQNSEHLLDNIEVINKQLIDWVATGAVKFLGPTESIKSKIRTSLVLVYNESSDKHRCCFDGGSFKVTQGYSVPCKLDTLNETLLFINKDDYLSKYDDSSGFLQAYLDEPSQNMTHFRWGSFIFKFFAAAFGIARVPSDFQLLNNCAVSFLRRHGVPVSLYLDDRLVVEKDMTSEKLKLIQLGKTAPKNAFLTCTAMIAAGGFISRKKSTFICSKQINFLGFDICTETETISIPPAKWVKFQKELEEVLESEFVHYKDLERLRGKMCSFMLVIMNMRLYIRKITEYLVQADKDKNKILKLDKRLRSELNIWRQSELKYLKTTRHWVEKRSETVEMQRYKVSTDASNMAGGWVDIDGTERTFYWEQKDQHRHINIKEAIAIKAYILTNKTKLINKRIMFLCDNMCVVKTFKFGSKVAELNDEILIINKLAVELNAIFSIQHVTTDIQEADEASRTLDLKEEIISEESYRIILDYFGEPDIDCMANFTNTKCKKYYSRFKEDQSLGTNFLSKIPNKNLKLYCFPPKTIVHIAAKHIYDLGNSFCLIFHVFSELPYFVAHRPNNSILLRLDNKVIIPTWIPCHKIKGKMFLEPNRLSGALYCIISLN
jgi:hypothetical protein